MNVPHYNVAGAMNRENVVGALVRPVKDANTPDERWNDVGVIVARHQTFTGTSNENDVMASRLLVLWSNGALSMTFMDNAVALVDPNGVRLR